MNATDREPTDEQLRAAWRALATDEWGDYDKAKTAALRFAIARARARVIASGRRLEPAPAVHTAPATEAAPPPSWGGLRVSHPQPIFDRKRAAAGEREDD